MSGTGRIAGLYRKLHPSDNLCTILGVGEHTVPIFLASVGDPVHFQNQSSAFANWEGVVPEARQSFNVEAKGLRMTKAGSSIMRMALFPPDLSTAPSGIKQLIKCVGSATLPCIS